MNSCINNKLLITHQHKVKNRLKEIDDTFQLIIIGGGIYGAALCWEASHRGIKTLLIEKDDYACGASSNSLKTIHGGLRSLQSLNFPAVIKGIRERSIFLKIAKNYVKALPCVMPTTKCLKRSKAFIGSGLLAYNVISFFIKTFSFQLTKLPRARLLSLSELRKRLAILIDKNFTGGGLWYDAQVENTERMVLQFIKAANKYDAVTLNHSEATTYTCSKEDNQHNVLITDRINGEEKYVKASAVVDCTSAWSFISQKIAKKEFSDDITFLKSVNIVIKKRLSEIAFGINISECDTKENRLYFFAPWRDCTIIGTWYSFEDKHPDHSFSKLDAINCIQNINTALNNQKINLDDICNVHIGSLPAHSIQSSDNTNIDKYLLSLFQFKDWSEELDKAPNLYSLRGTKYTLARHDAKQVIDQLSSTLKWDISESKSEKIPLYQEYSGSVALPDISEKTNNRLIINYGKDIRNIIQLINEIPQSTEVIPGTENHILAEIYHTVLNEQALTLSDLLKRRLNIGDRAPPKIETSNYCANIMQELLSWSDEQVKLQITELYASYPHFLTDIQLQSPHFTTD